MKSNTLIHQTALQTIEIEKNTISALAASINMDFVETVQLIFGSQGRVVVTGLGKSAIIGQKIVATLNSTGTPAIFMHAADAIHGDLGMIQADDVVLCLSKSGETSEIKVLTPFLKNRGNVLIAMTSAAQSYLGRHADYVLHTPVDREADPNNLAPTSSTTAQVVMGDALATALLALRGFTSNDFAAVHPGGSLGKQLYLRVSDIFPQNAKPLVLETTPLQEVIVEMTSKRLGCTAVVNAKQEVVGIITDGDLRRMLEKGLDTTMTKIQAQQIMTPRPKLIDSNTLAVNALAVIRKHSITQLIVVEQGIYRGIVHLHDLLREGLV